MAEEQGSQLSNEDTSAKSAQDEAMAHLRARREAKEKAAAEKAAAEKVAEAKAAQAEAMAHLRARREAQEKEAAEKAAAEKAADAKAAQAEAMARLREKREAKEKVDAANAAEREEMEAFKAQKQNRAKSAKLAQEAEVAVAPARTWEFFAEHTVAPGENLSKISEKYYGNQGYWKPLYDANQAVIGSNPNVIVPGQVLKIPKL